MLGGPLLQAMDHEIHDEVAMVAIRTVAGFSVIGSAYVFVHFARLPYKTLLTKQLMHLAVMDCLAFAWVLQKNTIYK